MLRIKDETRSTQDVPMTDHEDFTEIKLTDDKPLENTAKEKKKKEASLREKARQDEKRRSQEERKSTELLKRQQKEQRKSDLLKQQEEQKKAELQRTAELLKQQEEQKKAELLKRQEELRIAKYLKQQQRIKESGDEIDEIESSDEESNAPLSLSTEQILNREIAFKSPKLAALAIAINTFRQRKPSPNFVEFVYSLQMLGEHLDMDLQKQTDEHKTEAAIDASTAILIANKTVELLGKLGEPNPKDKNYTKIQLAILTQYENDCKKIEDWKTALKIFAMVLITAVCFFLGAIVGMGFGIWAGAWLTPLAFVKAATEAVTGAAASVYAFSTGTASAGLASSGMGLFRQPKLANEAGRSADLGKSYIDPEHYAPKSASRN